MIVDIICAWCHTKYGEKEMGEREAVGRLQGITHGMCPSCHEGFLDSIEEAEEETDANDPPSVVQRERGTNGARDTQATERPSDSLPRLPAVVADRERPTEPGADPQGPGDPSSATYLGDISLETHHDRTRTERMEESPARRAQVQAQPGQEGLVAEDGRGLVRRGRDHLETLGSDGRGPRAREAGSPPAHTEARDDR